jgi:hypothetical protein
MPPVGFKPAILANQWPQTYALDHAVTGIGRYKVTFVKIGSHHFLILLHEFLC